MNRLVMPRGLPTPRYLLITAHQPPIVMNVDNLATLIDLLQRQAGTPFRHDGCGVYKIMERDRIYRD